MVRNERGCRTFAVFRRGLFDLVFGRAVLHHTRDLDAHLPRVVSRTEERRNFRSRARACHFQRARFAEISSRVYPLHRHYGGENAYRLIVYTDCIRRAGFQLERVLTPLRSPINIAPHSIESLQHELARRVSLGIPLIAAMWRGLMRLEIVLGEPATSTLSSSTIGRAACIPLLARKPGQNWRSP